MIQLRLGRRFSALLTAGVLMLATIRATRADQTTASAAQVTAQRIAYLAPSGEPRWFSDADLRRTLGEKPYADFRASGLSLNAWIHERNQESVGLTVAEVATFTLAGLGLLVGGGLIVGGIRSPDALGRGIGWGLGLPIAGAGLVFGGVGVCLVWVDGQDRGSVKQPEFARESAGRSPLRLALSLHW
ncbi:MAG TPA: hypothetical protein VFH68_10290 [Polyangia bacterium]|nr:hypothetical protein [Polyangia bacterium]